MTAYAGSATLAHAMHHEVALPAPAKVNLHLEVLKLRPDGYHDIVSIFQEVSLADILHVRAAGGPGEIRITGDFDFPPENNIITRVIRSFRDQTGLTAGIEVEVEKKIPIAAGLGGGSSDAAAMLRCLAALFDIEMPPQLSRALAADLGSDVPFFLGVPAAVVEGRGELLSPLTPRVDFAIAAVLPGVRISTAEAFQALEREGTRPEVGLSPAQLRQIYAAMPPAQWPFGNSFDAVICALHPKVERARDALRAAGACSARLTGSGSTVIGIFSDPDEARACIARLSAAGHAAVLLLPLATIPDVCYNSQMRIRQWEDTHGDYRHSHQEGRI
ncbi:MAG: 4-(cytidine 5'-diphospho)-2-C-methyl-D-erythritol kinase [Spirochaetia bacterium]